MNQGSGSHAKLLSRVHTPILGPCGWNQSIGRLERCVDVLVARTSTKDISQRCTSKRNDTNSETTDSVIQRPTQMQKHPQQQYYKIYKMKHTAFIKTRHETTVTSRTRKLDHTTKDAHGVPERTQERHKTRELKRQTPAVAQFRRRLKCTQHYES